MENIRVIPLYSQKIRGSLACMRAQKRCSLSTILSRCTVCERDTVTRQLYLKVQQPLRLPLHTPNFHSSYRNCTFKVNLPILITYTLAYVQMITIKDPIDSLLWSVAVRRTYCALRACVLIDRQAGCRTTLITCSATRPCQVCARTNKRYSIRTAVQFTAVLHRRRP